MIVLKTTISSSHLRSMFMTIMLLGLSNHFVFASGDTDPDSLKTNTSSFYNFDLNCSDKLNAAIMLYKNGQVKDVYPLISSCLKDGGFSKSEKLRAYKLLAWCNIYLQNQEEASVYIKKSLRMDPYLLVFPSSEPSEYVDIIGQYGRSPAFAFGVDFGGNMSVLEKVQAFDADEGLTERGYENKFGFNVNVHTGVYFFQRIFWMAEFGYVQQQYNNYIKDLFNFYDFTYDESLSTFNLSTAIEVDLNKSHDKLYSGEYANSTKNKPYMFLKLGAYASSLNTASAEMSANPNSGNEDEIISPKQDVSARRIAQTWGIYGGAGVKYRVKKFTFYGLLQYHHSMEDIVNKENIYANSASLYQYGYVDNIFKMHRVSLSLGVRRNFFLFRRKR